MKEKELIDLPSKAKPERQYLSESHRKYSEACQKEVGEMAEDPLTYEQFLEQIAEQNRESELGDMSEDTNR